MKLTDGEKTELLEHIEDRAAGLGLDMAERKVLADTLGHWVVSLIENRDEVFKRVVPRVDDAQYLTALIDELERRQNVASETLTQAALDQLDKTQTPSECDVPVKEHVWRRAKAVIKAVEDLRWAKDAWQKLKV
jgi:hypothetical protein